MLSSKRGSRFFLRSILERGLVLSQERVLAWSAPSRQSIRALRHRQRTHRVSTTVPFTSRSAPLVLPAHPSSSRCDKPSASSYRPAASDSAQYSDPLDSPS